MDRKQYSVRNLAEDEQRKGRYLMDYSKQYQPPYSIVDKARNHVIINKKRMIFKNDMEQSEKEEVRKE